MGSLNMMGQMGKVHYGWKMTMSKKQWEKQILVDDGNVMKEVEFGKNTVRVEGVEVGMRYEVRPGDKRRKKDYYLCSW